MLTILSNLMLLLWICGTNWLVLLVVDHRLIFGTRPVTFSNFIEQDYEWFIYGIALLLDSWSIYYVLS